MAECEHEYEERHHSITGLGFIVDYIYECTKCGDELTIEKDVS